MFFALVIMLILSPFPVMTGGYLGLWLSTRGGAE
jgi:hypothetical protein